MALVKDWQRAEAALPASWADAQVELTLEADGEAERAIALLAPLQPLRTGPDTVALRIVRGGDGPSAAGLAAGARPPRRGAAPRDAGGRRGRGARARSRAARRDAGGVPARVVGRRARPRLPADWSDLLGEIELGSSDYLEPGAVLARADQPAPDRRQPAPAVPQREPASATAPRRAWSAAASSAATRPGCAGASRVLRVLSDTPARRNAGARLADRRPDGLAPRLEPAAPPATPARYPRSSAPKRSASAATIALRSRVASSSVSVRSADW